MKTPNPNKHYFLHNVNLIKKEKEELHTRVTELKLVHSMHMGVRSPERGRDLISLHNLLTFST
jgi:hypothetical protein